MFLPLFMAVMNRWRGHSSSLKRFFPRPLPQIVLALPYAAICAPPESTWWGSGLILILATLAWLTGHGRFMSLNDHQLTGKPETLEFIIRPFLMYIPNYLYKVLGLAVTGLAVTVPAGVVLSSPFLALSGALKAPAYMIGCGIEKWAVSRGKTKRRVSSDGITTYQAISFLPRHLDEGTAIGEFLTGLFLGAAIVLK